MSLQAKLRLDESETLMDLFIHAYRCLGHTDTHTFPSIPIGLYALQHINTQLSYKGAHISSLLSISILAFPYTLRSSYFLLLSCTHTLVLPYPCPTVSCLDTQNCVCCADICRPVLQTRLCPLPYVFTQILPCVHTDICPCPSATHSAPHHFSLFLKSLSVSISNFYKRHVSFRLVLKGNVFVDSHASRLLGSQNHLWHALTKPSRVTYYGGWRRAGSNNSGLLLNDTVMCQGVFQSSSKLDPVISGFTSIEKWSYTGKRARATVDVPN